MTSKKSATDGPDINPGSQYKVDAVRRFRFETIGFGPLSETTISGAILLRLLASDYKDAVGAYSLIEPTASAEG